jgi:ABC-2 type transport system permease protein
MLWVLDWVSAYDQSAWGKIIAYLSVVTHFEPFSKGVIDTKDVIFYLSMIFFGLFSYLPFDGVFAVEGINEF